MRTHRRPSSLSGLLLRAASIHRRRVAGAIALGALVAGSLVRAAGCDAPPQLATFNIENYPKSAAQEEGAFEAIRASGSPVVGVQEITDPAGFCAAARRRLGERWACAFTDRPLQRVGVLYDGGVYKLHSTVTHRETELYEGAKPALEARLQPAGADVVIHLFVLHLKAGGDGGPMRAAQLHMLAPIVAAAVRTGNLVTVLGDFNATGPDDRTAIRSFAGETGLRFSSEDLPCTAYWNRRDGCLGQALDHVLTSFPAAVEAQGPCRSEGCEMRPSCPVFHGTVSDHCPVVVRF